jgi:hypothetical protein
MWRGRYTLSSRAIAPPREWPTRATLVALYLEIVFLTADNTAFADLHPSVLITSQKMWKWSYLECCKANPLCTNASKGTPGKSSGSSIVGTKTTSATIASLDSASVGNKRSVDFHIIQTFASDLSLDGPPRLILGMVNIPRTLMWWISNKDKNELLDAAYIVEPILHPRPSP